ncbi:putative PurR-regulated permease PerM [Stackebrandtia albiflava]|uniref:Putative PurR-regulated permease PerM n=1 Tax=Stackebrandtia albiflava TaxID=406432 RepID=A0A562V183_9ACTN|nr:AI-2E family transporter [Stackebrandtia albiflava]TWJ11638.1 putative PurR-regulated permease PerM [Stackebrandtia albiflava]
MSRLGRTGARARQVWAALRHNPYVERVEQARRRNEDDLAPLEPPPIDPPEPEEIPEPEPEPRSDGIPNGLRIAAGWAWRTLITAAAVIAILYLADMLAVVVIPLLISLLLAAMLQPMVAMLVRWHVPRSLAAAVVLVAGLGTVAAVLTYVINQFIEGVPKLVENVQEGVQTIQTWAKEGPLHLEQKQIDDFFKQLTESLNAWLAPDPSSAAETTAVTLGVAMNILTGLFLVLFVTFFFMRDGRKIWTFLVKMLPANAFEPMMRAGNSSWRTLVSFVRATILVAVIDAVGIGAGLVLLDVPLAIPLAALVFLSAFVPIVGATVSGAVAVLVALVGDDWITALIVLGLVLAVQQLEGNVLQPLLMGRAVSIHPLAVVLAVSAGMVLGSIIGALIAVPIVAVVNAGVRQLRARPLPVEESPPPGSVST